MLEYAANGMRYWPVANLRAAFDEVAILQGTSGDAQINELGLDPETFWTQVADNLKAGRIRMIFVADQLPPELVRIIEFLNEQMTPTEVLGIEVPQFVGDGHQVLVPRVIGRTSTAVAQKQKSGRQWDEASFLDEDSIRHGPTNTEFFKRLFQHVRDHGVRLSWGKGISPGVSGWYSVGGEPTPVWNVNVGDQSTAKGGAYFYVYLPEVLKRAPKVVFDQFIAALTSIPAYHARIEDARLTQFESKYPSVFLSDLLQSGGQVDRLFSALGELSHPSA